MNISKYYLVRSVWENGSSLCASFDGTDKDYDVDENGEVYYYEAEVEASKYFTRMCKYFDKNPDCIMVKYYAEDNILDNKHVTFFDNQQEFEELTAEGGEYHYILQQEPEIFKKLKGFKLEMEILKT